MSLFNTIHLPTVAQAAVGLPVDMDDWTGANFIQYHQHLLSMGYSVNDARLIFNNDIASVGALATIYWAGEYDCDFLKYTTQNNLSNYGGILGNAYCGISTTVSATGSTAGNVASNVGSAISFLTKPIILIPVGGYLVYKLFLEKKLKRKR
jgi:hypothetical protein